VRDIQAVINQVLEQVPAEGYESLRTRLTRLRDDVPYTALESIARDWRKLVHILSSELKGVDTPWTRQISAIMQSNAS
jgi:hypothetical protein